MPRTLAAADIGSNTVHLLVAETNGQFVERKVNVSEWLALGESVARQKRITETQAIQLVTILKEFRDLAREHRAESLYVFATEALRAATNHEEVLAQILREDNIKVDLISPNREAEFSLRGTRLDFQIEGPFLLFEVGGGSAQIAHVRDGQITSELSLPLGTGRVVAEAGLQNPCPPECLGRAKTYIEDNLMAWQPAQVGLQVLASGGVVRGLWRAVHPDGEHTIAREEIDYLIWATSRLSVSQISLRFGCKLKRAATLLPGALVYQQLLSRAEADSILVSEYGVREGAILAMFEGSVDWCRL